MKLRGPVARAVVLVLIVSLTSSCGSNSESFCSGITSVSDFVSRFALGLDNFSESEYSQLRLDALDAYDVVMVAVKESKDPNEAVRLSRSLQKFINEMDKVDWDVTLALNNEKSVSAASEIGSSESLVRANSVEAFVISRCGLPSTLPSNIAPDTLPLPSIPGPTDTEPPANTIDQDSEHFATGMLLGSIYGLSLSQFEATCLGRELDGVVDLSASNANSSAYIAQFQRAFDTCDVPFTVPRES